MKTLAKPVMSLFLMLLASEALAQVGGIERSVSFFNTVRGWLLVVVPIVSVMLGILITVIYMSTELIRKETLYRFGVGLGVVTIISPLVSLAFGNAG